MKKKSILSVILAVIFALGCFGLSGCNKNTPKVLTDEDYINAAESFADRSDYSVELSGKDADRKTQFDLKESENGFAVESGGQKIMNLNMDVREIFKAIVPDDASEIDDKFERDGETLTTEIELSENINAFLSVLQYAYAHDGTLKSVLDDLTADAPNGTFSEQLHHFGELIKSNPDKTLGEFRTFIEDRYDVDIVDVLTALGVNMTDARLKAFSSCTFGELVSSAAYLISNDVPTPPTPGTKVSVSFEVGSAAERFGVSAPKMKNCDSGDKLGNVEPIYSPDATNHYGFGKTRHFEGWRDKNSGKKYTADTVVTESVVLEAVWKVDTASGAEYDASAEIWGADQTSGGVEIMWVHYYRADHDNMENSTSNNYLDDGFDSNPIAPIDSEVYGDWVLWARQSNGSRRLFFPLWIDQSGAIFEIWINHSYDDFGWDNTKKERGNEQGMFFPNGSLTFGIINYDTLLRTGSFDDSDGGDFVCEIMSGNHTYVCQGYADCLKTCEEMYACSGVEGDGKKRMVSYDIGYGIGFEFGVNPPDPVLVDNGSKLGALVDAKPDGMDGYTAKYVGFGDTKLFVGWKDGNGNRVNRDTVITKDTTLYPIWQIKEKTPAQIDSELAEYLAEVKAETGKELHDQAAIISYLRSDHLPIENGMYFTQTVVNGQFVNNYPECSYGNFSDAYRDWGLWVWQDGKEGRLFHPLSIAECGAVFYITYNYEYTDCGWDSTTRKNKGLKATYTPDKRLCYQVVNIPSMQKDGFWQNDCGDRYLFPASDPVFLYQNKVMPYNSMTEMTEDISALQASSRASGQANAALSGMSGVDINELFDALIAEKHDSDDLSGDIAACEKAIFDLLGSVEIKAVVDAMSDGDFITAAIKQVLTSNVKFTDCHIKCAMYVAYKDNEYVVDRLELEINFAHDAKGYKTGFLSANDYMFKLTVR